MRLPGMRALSVEPTAVSSDIGTRAATCGRSSCVARLSLGDLGSGNTASACSYRLV